jgi:hypothetical protein
MEQLVGACWNGLQRRKHSPWGCDAAQLASTFARSCSAAVASPAAAAAASTKACMQPSSRHSGAGSSNSILQLFGGPESCRSTLQLVPARQLSKKVLQVIQTEGAQAEMCNSVLRVCNRTVNMWYT